MRRGGVFILVFLMLAVFTDYTRQKTMPGVARAQELQSQTEDGERPSIVFSETVFDFGEIDVGEKVEHIFAFRNRGDATLVIGKVRSG